MGRAARRGGDQPRRRWPWTVAAVALASAWAAVARARARRRPEAAGDATAVEGVGDRHDPAAAARQKAAAVAASAKQVAGRAVDAAKDTPHMVGDAVTRLRDKAVRRRPDGPGEYQTVTENDTAAKNDTEPVVAAGEAPPEPTTERQRSGEPGGE